MIMEFLEANSVFASNNPKPSLKIPSIGISTTLLSLCSILLLAALTFFFFWKKDSPHSLPPGPKPWPIVGNLPELLRNKPTFRWIHKMMEDMGAEILCIRLGNVHVISVTSPEIAVEFLKKHDIVFSSRPICLSAELTSRGYLTTALTPLGEHWKKMRRVLATYVLSPARHRWLTIKRAEEADHLVRYVFNQGGLVNVREAAQHLLRKRGKEDDFWEEVFRGGEGGWRRMDLDGHERIMRRAIQSVTKYQDPEIDERIRQWNEGTRKEEKDLLDVLLMLKDKDGSSPLLSTDEIKAQIVELMIASVDNPSNAVEWALAEMINQPETLERAKKELDQVIGKDRLVQESDLPNLNYIKSCVREAFRLHPIAPFNVPHVSVSDATVAGYFIPKGSHVLLSRPGLGRNPSAWTDPLRFRPERHLKEDGSDVVLTDPDLRMLSFSIGRRGCAGVTLGSTMTVMLLALLVQGFNWELPPNVSEIELKESHGDLFLSKPLVALARPRLANNLYPSL
ncbi:cytochrome P450, family 79, subfamily B, polypeptide 2 [Actinidia rufa]|uniref:Cytochrome P450, family 79, subfamily B, polypeptide 2 n=1 Tax=Actinidia rufa TaxID=165716 RepID=A0A7J0HA42_9ERIC|nr:cytochrome P450, family 79, subfamily B, polypeptide 2 [Actinidia rufa]